MRVAGPSMWICSPKYDVNYNDQRQPTSAPAGPRGHETRSWMESQSAVPVEIKESTYHEPLFFRMITPTQCIQPTTQPSRVGRTKTQNRRTLSTRFESRVRWQTQRQWLTAGLLAAPSRCLSPLPRHYHHRCRRPLLRVRSALRCPSPRPWRLRAAS